MIYTSDCSANWYIKEHSIPITGQQIVDRQFIQINDIIDKINQLKNSYINKISETVASKLLDDLHFIIQNGLEDFSTEQLIYLFNNIQRYSVSTEDRYGENIPGMIDRELTVIKNKLINNFKDQLLSFDFYSHKFVVLDILEYSLKLSENIDCQDNQAILLFLLSKSIREDNLNIEDQLIAPMSQLNHNLNFLLINSYLDYQEMFEVQQEAVMEKLKFDLLNRCRQQKSLADIEQLRRVITLYRYNYPLFQSLAISGWIFEV